MYKLLHLYVHVNILKHCKSTIISYLNDVNFANQDWILLFKVIEKCTNFYFGTEKLPPKF